MTYISVVRNLQGFTAEDLAITDIMKKALKTTVVLDASTTEDQVIISSLASGNFCCPLITIPNHLTLR